MGLFKKKIVKKTYEREHMKPVIRASICTGEEVVGFKDIRTGKIEEIMLIRSPEDLERFKEIYEIRDPWRIIIQPLDENEEPYDPCNIDEIAGVVRIVEVKEVSNHYE